MPAAQSELDLIRLSRSGDEANKNAAMMICASSIRFILLVVLLTAVFASLLPSVSAAQQRYEERLRSLPADLSEDDVRDIDGLRYSTGTRKLIWESERKMTEDVRDQLRDMSSDAAWAVAVDALYEKAKATLQTDGGWREPFFFGGDPPVTTMLLAIADAYKLNIVLPLDLNGTFIAHQLNNVPAMVAIRAILLACGHDLITIPNHVEPDNPILLVVPAQEPQPERHRQVIVIPEAPPGHVELCFDPLVNELRRLLGDGDTLVANPTSRVVMVAAPEATCARAKRYVQAVVANLPLVGDAVATDRAPTTRVFHVPERVNLDGVVEGFDAVRSAVSKLAVNAQTRIIVVRDSADVVELMETYLEAVCEAVSDRDD